MYKRQDVDGTLMDFKAAEKQALSGCLQELGVEPADALIGEYSRTVSYTHLDVYKRQE